MSFTMLRIYINRLQRLGYRHFLVWWVCGWVSRGTFLLIGVAFHIFIYLGSRVHTSGL